MTESKRRITAVSLGQPKKVTKPRIEIDLTEVERLASLGLNLEQVAKALGICEKTLRNRKKDNSDFAEAIKRGKAKATAHVANRLMQKIDKGDTTAMIFYLKTQAGWKETSRQEVTGADGGAIKLEQNDIRSFTNEQLLEIARMNEDFSKADAK